MDRKPDRGGREVSGPEHSADTIRPPRRRSAGHLTPSDPGSFARILHPSRSGDGRGRRNAPIPAGSRHAAPAPAGYLSERSVHATGSAARLAYGETPDCRRSSRRLTGGRPRCPRQGGTCRLWWPAVPQLPDTARTRRSSGHDGQPHGAARTAWPLLRKRRTVNPPIAPARDSFLRLA